MTRDKNVGVGPESEGDNKQRRDNGRAARDEGRLPSEDAATMGASKQRKKVDSEASHEERLTTKNKGKQDSLTRDKNEPKPGSIRQDD
jgi:hypothetical protein